MRILVTGGAGYIGSHLVLDLLADGHDVVVVDDFRASHPEVLRRVAELAGRPCELVRADIAEGGTLSRALRGVDAVFHLAGSKIVPESMAMPERYFLNNLGGMAVLLDAMERAGVRRVVYSSSAAVYGSQRETPIAEAAPTQPESPYGQTKLHGEAMLGWMAARRGWAATSLRYFNPVGSHPSGRIGQPVESATALVPRALQALLGGPPITVFGADWPTPDGTCLRDYVHISDLSRAHLSALEGLTPGTHAIYNVGTGTPHSVREVLDACGRAAGRPVPAVEGARREGDMACATADPTSMARALGFHARLGLDEMVGTAWRWSRDNIGGYT